MILPITGWQETLGRRFKPTSVGDTPLAMPLLLPDTRFKPTDVGDTDLRRRMDAEDLRFKPTDVGDTLQREPLRSRDPRFKPTDVGDTEPEPTEEPDWGLDSNPRPWVIPSPT